MRKIENNELGRPTPQEFELMEKLPVTVVLDNVRSLNNVGSVFRTCDAFAIERIMLCGITATPPNKEIHKTALGAENTVAWEYFRTTKEAVDRLKTERYILTAVEQVEGATMLHRFQLEPKQRYALIFGNEVDGVAQDIVDLCDGAIEIPQVGTKHSLNIAVSVGAVLWQTFATSPLNK